MVAPVVNFWTSLNLAWTCPRACIDSGYRATSARLGQAVVCAPMDIHSLGETTAVLHNVIRIVSYVRYQVLFTFALTLSGKRFLWPIQLLYYWTSPAMILCVFALVPAWSCAHRLNLPWSNYTYGSCFGQRRTGATHVDRPSSTAASYQCTTWYRTGTFISSFRPQHLVQIWT